MSIDQEPSYPITDKNDIELIRMYMSEYVRHTFSNHLLYFNLAINTGLKTKILLSYKWNDILNLDMTVKDYLQYNNYKLYLNNTCKRAIYDNLNMLNNIDFNNYVFGNRKNKPIISSTINKVYRDIHKDLNIGNLCLNTGSLYKTFIYWQIYYNCRDYIKLAKLQDMLYPTSTNLWKISNYNIDNDYIYINDVNL
ncbi:hypothetical protein [Blautia wexlerae]|uniref:hypothetical protein n=1 Tax=Blautia wexlerae TaxID=418240 RepID=UPI00156D85BD|nr:hypothetical protein [Blautia wexlerae]NSD47790.1 hypothetical protein [Blautia wexlerae]NSD52190.1 hypothetical protein [Blautia wexlerae]NSK05500.1 hypothetical protein [Blautia wexlerae]